MDGGGQELQSSCKKSQLAGSMVGQLQASWPSLWTISWPNHGRAHGSWVMDHDWAYHAWACRHGPWLQALSFFFFSTSPAQRLL
jgi:hypothetical protein